MKPTASHRITKMKASFCGMVGKLVEEWMNRQERA